MFAAGINASALELGMIRVFLLASLVVAALANFGYRTYLRENASEHVKRMCAHEPMNFFYKNQDTDCLARNGR
jgi:hypothetical protein